MISIGCHSVKNTIELLFHQHICRFGTGCRLPWCSVRRYYSGSWKLDPGGESGNTPIRKVLTGLIGNPVTVGSGPAAVSRKTSFPGGAVAQRKALTALPCRVATGDCPGKAEKYAGKPEDLLCTSLRMAWGNGLLPQVVRGDKNDFPLCRVLHGAEFFFRPLPF